jgi:uncharacterized integral membrane protein
MGTTQVILLIIGITGTILAFLSLYQMVTTKGEIKRSSCVLLATGQMLVSPYATLNLLTESGVQWKIIFVLVLLTGLIAVFNLASNTKKK